MLFRSCTDSAKEEKFEDEKKSQLPRIMSRYLIFRKFPFSFQPIVYLILFVAMVNGIASLISLSDFSLFSSVQFSSVTHSCPTLSDPVNWSTPGLSITNSQSSLKLMSIESVMPSSHLILYCPLLLLPQSLPASESFPMSQLFA